MSLPPATLLAQVLLWFLTYGAYRYFRVRCPRVAGPLAFGGALIFASLLFSLVLLKSGP